MPVENVNLAKEMKAKNNDLTLIMETAFMKKTSLIVCITALFSMTASAEILWKPKPSCIIADYEQYKNNLSEPGPSSVCATEYDGWQDVPSSVTDVNFVIDPSPGTRIEIADRYGRITSLVGTVDVDVYQLASSLKDSPIKFFPRSMRVMRTSEPVACFFSSYKNADVSSAYKSPDVTIYDVSKSYIQDEGGNNHLIPNKYCQPANSHTFKLPEWIKNPEIRLVDENILVELTNSAGNKHVGSGAWSREDLERQPQGDFSMPTAVYVYKK